MRSIFQDQLDEAIARYTHAEREDDFLAALAAIQSVREEEEATASLPQDGSSLKRVLDVPLDYSALPEADFLELLCGEPIEREVPTVELTVPAPAPQHSAVSP